MPDWREQPANSSSKAVRIFTSSLLWLSFWKERHYVSCFWARDNMNKLSLAQEQSHCHLWFHLTQFKRGVLEVRMEHHATPPESVYLACAEQGSWAFFLHSCVWVYLKSFEKISVLRKRHNLENVKSTGASFFMMNQHFLMASVPIQNIYYKKWKYKCILKLFLSL